MSVPVEESLLHHAAGYIAPGESEESSLLKLDELLEKEIRARIDGDRYLTSQVIPQVEKIRFLLHAGKIDDAQKLFMETQARVLKAEASLKSESTAFKLFGTELVFLAILLFLAYCTAKFPDYWVWQGMLTLGAKTAWFGALGGVTVALYGLYSHVQMRDFDTHFSLWYLCKPVVGAIFGWFVYIVYFLGLVSVQGSTVDVKTPAVPFAIAFLAGFSERFTVQIIDKVVEVLTTWKEKPDEGKTN
jgi:hypothetical protein